MSWHVQQVNHDSNEEWLAEGSRLLQSHDHIAGQPARHSWQVGEWSFQVCKSVYPTRNDEIGGLARLEACCIRSQSSSSSDLPLLLSRRWTSSASIQKVCLSEPESLERSTVKLPLVTTPPRLQHTVVSLSNTET